MRDLAATPRANPSNGDSLAPMRRDSATKLVFAVLVVYLITNRSIPDEYVLPMDMSIRVSQLVLIGLGLALVLATSRSLAKNESRAESPLGGNMASLLSYS